MTIIEDLGARTRQGHVIPSVSGIPEKQDIFLNFIALFYCQANNQINAVPVTYLNIFFRQELLIHSEFVRF